MASASPRPLRIVFCWSEVGGYMAACWRALASRPGVHVHVLHPQELDESVKNPFELQPLLAGISNEMFRRDRADLDAWLRATVVNQRPDIIVHCGWIFWPYTRLLDVPELANVTMVIGMDSPWRGTLVQRVAPIRLARLARRMRKVIVAGERSAEYARRIGFAESSIVSGYYGFDDRPLADVGARRASPWPRRFLFVGRYVDQKDLPTLVAGYQRYRTMVSDPWPLTCCGTGPEGHLLQGIEGITDIGFRQPADLPEVFATHGVFVMASKFEPWGVVIAEAAATELPIVCTSACGASVDLVRPFYNGIVTPPSDADSLARALVWTHEHVDELPEMGRRGRQLAQAFTADAWAARWHNYLLDAVTRDRAQRDASSIHP